MADLSIFHAALVHCFGQLMLLTAQPTSFINESEFMGHPLLLKHGAAPMAHNILQFHT